MKRILFVCMGNICRSPTAEGVFSRLLKTHNLQDEYIVDSAGTHAYHIGNSPDLRAQHHARMRGIDLGHLQARQVSEKDFEVFDYIVAMDNYNYALLIELSADSQQDKVVMMMQFASTFNEAEVPDPYYGGDNGFERVLDMLEDATQGLLKFSQQTNSSSETIS